jgi:hypothetical protein
MAEITETVPFNFDELYSELKTKFDEKGYDTEEGSNTSQLITAMTYLTSMLNVNTAVNINETILPLATKRDNVLQDARALGYEIQHKQSYSYILALSFTAGNHTIPKYSEFLSGDKKYYYIGEQIELTDWVEGEEIELVVVEGELHKYTEDSSSLSVTTTYTKDSTGTEIPQYSIEIPFVDVEEDGIEVFVTYYDDYGNLVSKEEWTRSKTFMIDSDTTLNKEYIRLDSIEYKTPTIYFTLAGVGSGLRVGSIVNMNVLTTSGSEGALENMLDTDSVTHNIANAEITEISLLSEGAGEESIESIKLNAPKFYNSANRAVTKADYEAFCNRQSSVDTSLVWGGDDEYPKSPGHIWFSFLPATTNKRTFTSDEFNYEYLLDDWGDLEWDYTLDSESDEWKNQLNTNDEFYNQRFLQDSEIKAYEYNDNGQLINPGVWDDLDNYKIPTLEFHNRHPIFLDFEYDINIIRYNITDSKAIIHENLFNTVDSFFTGENDSINMEQFENEYFHSSLEKRIDTVLTDDTGYTNRVTTKILLTKKNVAVENENSEYRDIFIPMAVPFENYFENDGSLIYEKLPNIDTSDFIDYGDGNITGVYTDWSDVENEIQNGISQSSSKLIIASIRASEEETVISDGTTLIIEFQNITIVPDEISQIDSGSGEFTFEKTKIYLNDVLVPYDSINENGFGWSYTSGESDKIELTQTPSNGDIIRVETNPEIGRYHLFNSYKKYIMVQFFVNAVGYGDQGSTKYDFDTPKSYLTTTERFYGFTENEFYLTTEGYAVVLDSELTSESGSKVTSISPSNYIYSTLRMDLFRKNRYLNLNYDTKNFAVLKNVIPRLKRVSFQKGN